MTPEGIAEPRAIKANSPLGLQMVTVAQALDALTNVIPVRSIVSGFSYFVARVSLESGIPDADFEKSLVELVHLCRLNRANTQSKASTIS